MVGKARSSDVGKRLSIIVPAYNCEAYLDECLESVTSQLPPDCELIVVDDGSQDSTPRKLAALDGVQDNLCILLREHGGASAARNAGLAAANGEFIAFLDCDDRMCPGF